MINSRKIEDLLPPVAFKCNNLIQYLASEGIDIIITSTYRDFESQNALYAQGRTTKGSVVTNAKGGDSFHNYRMAFDVVPIVNGKAIWNDSNLWKRIGIAGKLNGLEWAGDWVKFKEMAHMQDTEGMTIKQLKEKYPNGL